MKIVVACEAPGYLRLRAPRYSITEEQSHALQRFISKLTDIKSAEVNAYSGSILIKHHGNAESIIEAVSKVSLADLPVVSPHERDLKYKIDHDFKTLLTSAVGVRLFTRYILPNPLSTAWTIYCAGRYVAKGLAALGRGNINVDVLDGAAVGVSVGFGHFKSAGSIMFLLGISEILEDYARQRTRNALSTSLIFNVDAVWVRVNDVEVQKSLSQIEIGDQVIVRSGSMIPVDGEVIEGEAGVNQSSMTGESVPILKSIGDSVFAGTVIEEGHIVVEVRALPNDSRIHSILSLLEENENAKAAVAAKAEALAEKIVPYNFLFAGLVLLLTRNGHKALSALTVDYSCAIKLATPIAVISAMSEASKKHIMIKGGKYMEALAEADTIIFDKTGTLTMSEPVVKKVLPLGAMAHDDVLRLAACLEEHFPHSLARAIVRQAEKEGLLHKEDHAEVEYIVAHGIVSKLDGKRVVIGSRHFIVEDEKVIITAEQEAEIERHQAGFSCVYLGVDGQLEGVICIQDPPRPEAKEVIEHLRTLGIKNIVMLTGDGEHIAKSICEELGINHYAAQVLPETKSNEVKKWQDAGHRVIMVGDGVNDSPALAQADVSVALRDSSDIAREVADVVLLSGDLRALCTARMLSQRLMKRISSNFGYIVGINTGLLVFGAMGALPVETTAVLHNISTAVMSGRSTRPLLPLSYREENTIS